MKSPSSSEIQPKVSVIVPVYNVAQYIEKCARSLFEQTLDSLEIIFVDDCSPDNSIEIVQDVLKDYPHRINQTKFIRLSQNSGLSSARKNGLKESTGEYIIHCDSDDWVDLDLYEKLYQEAIKSNSDVVICNVKNVLKTKIVQRNMVYPIDQGKDLIKYWYKKPFSLYCWNKLVKREIYIKYDLLPWNGLNMWEDIGLISRVLYYSNKVSYVSDSFCYYNRQNISSITYQYGREATNQMIKIAQNLDEFFKDKPDYEDFKNTLNAFKYQAKLNLITDSFSDYKVYKTLFPEANKVIKHIPLSVFSKRGKIRFLMVKYGFAPFFILLYKVKNKVLPSINFK